MKKFFTLLTLMVMAMTVQAAITIYVKCDTAPYIWSWGSSDGVDYNVGSWPGTNQLTETYVHPDTGETFWTWTFAESVESINFLFNDGAASGTKQTGDINGVKTERWFLLSWDDGSGNVVCEDVTEDYSDVEIPDAEVNFVALVGNHNSWTSDDTALFSAVEAGKVFQKVIDLTEISIDENLWQFKFKPNNQDWVGYWDVYYDETPVEGKVSKEEAPTWLSVSNDGNFLIDLEEGTVEKIFTITVTWNGGKEAGKNWSFQIEAGNSAGINATKAATNNTAAIYNLQGQRVDSTFRGIAIQNGKKMLVK